MKKLFKVNYFNQNRQNAEKGQALLIVLSLLLLVSLIVTSTLTFVGVSIKTNQTFLNDTRALYAAESGIQDGIWQMLNQSSSDLALGLLGTATSKSTVQVPYSDYDFNTAGWTYQLAGSSNPINGDIVNVNVQNVWVPLVDDNNPSWIPTVSNMLTYGTINPPPLAEANNIINNTMLTVTGGVSNVPHYTVNITYTSVTALTITSVGVFLPQGFTYNNGSSNIQNSVSHAWLYSTEQVLNCAGNEAVVWTFPSGTTFSSLFTAMGQTGSTIAIQFNYTTTLQKLPDALAWVTDTANAAFPYAYTWDADVKVHDLTSTVGNTEVQAIVPKSETRSLGSAMAGDYVAAGASLMVIGNGYTPMTDPYSDGWVTQGVRYVLLSDSSSIVNTIPADSNVEGAYLYWSGWFNYTTMPAPTYGPVVNFKINGVQVDFNSSGSVERGTSGVASTRNQWRNNAITGGTGYSYSSYRDVTSLVKYELKTETGNPINPGNATYDVGPANGSTMGDTGNPWSYAGWSLIIVYSGPSTLGHQLYLYDTFSYADNGMDIDVTGNTSGPGGTISGFIVPNQVTGDINAAKLTCFVGDGDWCYSGDFISINAPSAYQTLSNIFNVPNQYRLWDGITLPAPTVFIPYGDPGLPNTAAQPDNVWNSYSQTGGAADGIDLKTFTIPWSSGLIHSGDTSARVDVPTAVDSWNFIYMIISFRSSVTSGGSISYLIRKIPTP